MKFGRNHLPVCTKFMFSSRPWCKGSKADLIHFISGCTKAEKWRHNIIQFNNTSVFPNVLISVVKCVIRDLALFPGLLSTIRTWYKAVYAVARKYVMMQWISYKPTTKNFCVWQTEFPNIWHMGLRGKEGPNISMQCLHLISRVNLRQFYLKSFVKFG